MPVKLTKPVRFLIFAKWVLEKKWDVVVVTRTGAALQGVLLARTHNCGVPRPRAKGQVRGTKSVPDLDP